MLKLLWREPRGHKHFAAFCAELTCVQAGGPGKLPGPVRQAVCSARGWVGRVPGKTPGGKKCQPGSSASVGRGWLVTCGRGAAEKQQLTQSDLQILFVPRFIKPISGK